jgi:hypothetical protein
MLTVAQFRSDFPEFADPSKYPDSQIVFWIALATNLVDPKRWATLAQMGVELATAHWLVVSARDRALAKMGATPGAPIGLQTSKSVADLSVSYDYTAVMAEGAGFWNQSSYGQRYFALARMFGAGGLQIR